MNLKQLAAMLLAVTMLTAGAVGAVAATPGNGNAPDDAGSQADDQAQDADSAGERGPPSELPEQVPDHVGEIHDTISSYLDGEVGNLGEALSGVTPGDDADGAEDGDDGVENAADSDDTDDEMTPTPTATA